ncbi:MAG: hypothetical protein A2Y15_07040 [Clostridiales bacterium GWF2_36_10]|nr:MAG: hypothetical protein A2Y15_07040 [Clostridiales bacterium GWF2_36_10]HAN21359.1 hypothetical protein [Clostridiales bacterium]
MKKINDIYENKIYIQQEHNIISKKAMHKLDDGNNILEELPAMGGDFCSPHLTLLISLEMLNFALETGAYDVIKNTILNICKYTKDKYKDKSYSTKPAMTLEVTKDDINVNFFCNYDTSEDNTKEIISRCCDTIDRIYNYKK